MAQPSYFIAVTLLDKRREFEKLVEGQELQRGKRNLHCYKEQTS